MKQSKKEKIAQKKKKTEIDPKKQIISAKDGFNRTLLIIINKCGTRKENEENPLEWNEMKHNEAKREKELGDR